MGIKIMILNVNIERSSKIYTDIEKFKDYEMTQCIIYEAAIRNDFFKEKLLSTVSNINKNYVDYLKGVYSNDTTIYAEKIHTDKTKINELILISFINNIMMDLRVIGINENEKQDLLKINEIQDFKIIKDFKKIFDKSKYTDGNDIVNINTGNGYIIKQTGDVIDLDDNFKLRNEVIQDFSRPVLVFRDGMHALVSLDFSYSKKTLQLYINKLYDDIKKNSSIPSAAFLLGEEISLIEENFLPYKTLNSEKFADCFFIYDYLKEAMRINKDLSETEIIISIHLLLTDYHNSEDKELNNYDSKYRKNIKSMTNLIENGKYKEFATKIVY